MNIRLRKESALNLYLEGSVGSFQVGSGVGGQTSLEVKYFLTHVGLNFAAGSNDALLSELAPVREIFDFKELDFDEIMQRDIDDARVSSELIPYLLDESTRDLIKFFPPIVVVVLPVQEDRNKPIGHYPEVSRERVPGETKEDHDLHLIRSGSVGQEVFQIEQPITGGEMLSHDLVRLRLNTHRSRLVIVDGQHRAMALLAIYRNLKDKWSDERRAPYKEYYAEWTPNYINRFRLQEINLPVILCTVPSLDTNYEGDYDLKKAARLIFLTLNKTARKVSNSRNILLNDNDLIAHFLRRCLSEVKKKDSRSPHSFRIWDVELDQFGDKLKIQSPVAVTGVNHVNYMIEHMLLDNGDVKGVAPRSGRFASRTTLVDCIDRLDGRNLLGAEVADSMRRDNYSAEAAETLGEHFFELYGKYIITAFETFRPIDCHNRATLALESRVEGFQDRQLRPILFEGQGIGRVFEAHRATLKQKLKEGYFHTDVPEIEESAKRLDSAADRIGKAISELENERARFFLSEVSDKHKIRGTDTEIDSKVVDWVTKLYDNIVSTVAFQSALICGFFGELEKANLERTKAGETSLDRDSTFQEYIEQLNNAFTPQTTSQLKKLIRVFTGEVIGDKAEEWKITASNQTFRSVVYRGEMQPDQWPKYKYLLMELWEPADSTLRASVRTECDRCRDQVFSALYESYKVAYCTEHRKLDEDLGKRELEAIFKQAFAAYSGFLKNIDAAALEDSAARQAVATVMPTEGEVVEESGPWETFSSENASEQILGDDERGD